MTLGAVVFDFDGLILDTEWPIYEMAAASFRELGVNVAVEDWATVVGLADEDHDWFELLAQRLQFDLDKAEFQELYRAQDRSQRDTLVPMPGVADLIDGLRAEQVPLGIASSSDLAWLERHLARVGLLERFDGIVGVDHADVGGLGKPDPASYRTACKLLGADPARSVALEDSAHGIAAARAAGLKVVAVPNRITRYSVLDQADEVVPSLEALSLAQLRDLV